MEIREQPTRPSSSVKRIFCAPKCATGPPLPAPSRGRQRERQGRPHFLCDPNPSDSLRRLIKWSRQLMQQLTFAGKFGTRLSAAPWICSKSTTAIRISYAPAFRIPVHSWANRISSSTPPTPCAYLKQATHNYVFSRLQSHCDDPAAALGDRISLGALRHSFLLQLLVRFIGASDRSQLESPELRAAVSQSSLSHRAAPFHQNRWSCNFTCAPARLSTRLLLVVPRRKAQRLALSARNYSAVGKLSGARLRLENDSRQRRRPKRFLAISSHHA